jgi:hypothetical protein
MRASARAVPAAYSILLLLAVSLSVQLMPNRALADQPQDWMVGSGKKGTYVNLDFIVGALQAGLEHRIPIYGGGNMLTLRGSSLAAIPYGSAQADVDLRIVNLTLGMSTGFMSVWRNQSFALGEPMNRKMRREREAGGEYNRDAFPFWEGRASMGFLLNDYVVFNHQTSVRLTDATDRSFNNVTAVVDDGDFVRADFQLFFKHKAIGSLAPVVQILNFGLDNKRHTQFNYGFMFVTRAGLVQKDDLLLFQMMFHPPGGVFAGIFDERFQSHIVNLPRLDLLFEPLDARAQLEKHFDVLIQGLARTTSRHRREHVVGISNHVDKF